MNLDNLARLRDALITGDGMPDVGFNMATWEPIHYSPDQSGRMCQTAMCIGGWCMHLARDEDWFNTNGETLRMGDYYWVTARYLGISEQQALDLAVPPAPKKLSDITLDEALTTLDKLRDTGKVDWSHVDPYKAHTDE